MLCTDGKFDNPLLVAYVDPSSSFFPDKTLTCESFDVLLHTRSQRGCDQARDSEEACLCCAKAPTGTPTLPTAPPTIMVVTLPPSTSPTTIVTTRKPTASIPQDMEVVALKIWE
jgi:hypothetical protein